MGRGKKPLGLAARAHSGPLRLELPAPERGFSLTERDGLTLVVPEKRGKMTPADWPVEERKFRSLIVDSDGRVVSAGFAKFGNFQEFPDETDLLVEALAADKPVFFSEKVDGSLLVRSVINGEVVFRTRGTFDGGEHGRAARRVAAKKYPVLLDPAFEPEHSLLFEFVSPDFRIIVSYPEDDLILLGRIAHADLTPDDFPQLAALAQEHALQLVECHELPTEPLALLKEIETWKGKEGVVARCNEGRVMVRIKAADYLARHRLRFALSARAVREICLERDVQGLDDFEVYLKEVGGDWELVEDAKPLVEAFCTARARARERVSTLAGEVAAKLVEYPVRKDFALEYATKLSGAEKAAAFSLADERRDQAYTVLERSYLDEAFATAEARDELLLAEDDA